MTGEIEPSESNAHQELNLHPASEDTIENDGADKPEDPIKKAIDIIIDRATPNDHLVFMTPEMLRTIHLAFPHYEDTSKISFMFKRSPEMKVYYPKIRKWFEVNNLYWRDSSFNHERYMRADIALDKGKLNLLTQSAHDDIFGIQAAEVASINSLKLQCALQGVRHPILMVVSAFTLAASLIFLPLYEVFKLNTFTSPSISGLDWPELFLIANLFLSLAVFKYSADWKIQKNSKKKLKRFLIRVGLLSAIGLSFFTH